MAYIVFIVGLVGVGAFIWACGQVEQERRRPLVARRAYQRAHEGELILVASLVLVAALVIGILNLAGAIR
jgi:hypothetical protein